MPRGYKQSVEYPKEGQGRRAGVAAAAVHAGRSPGMIHWHLLASSREGREWRMESLQSPTRLVRLEGPGAQFIWLWTV